MAWARVTEVGTPNSRWLCWAGRTEAARNWALVIVPVGPAGTDVVTAAEDGAGGGLHTGIVALVTTYACEIHCAVPAMWSHWAVLRTVPFTYWPLTRQSMATLVLFFSCRIILPPLFGAPRTFSLPDTLMADVVAASAAVASTSSTPPAAASANIGPSRNLLA